MSLGLAKWAVVLSLAQEDPAQLKKEVAELRGMVVKLQARIDELDARVERSAAPVVPVVAETSLAPVATAPVATPITAGQPGNGILGNTTLSLLFDGYYGYNFNRPIGRANLLRAYDVSSNSFTLNQAAVILENAPDLEKGKRYGLRLDLQFGQATQTLQGNPGNEPRPDIYRNIFQLYGTYVFPLGKGLTVDFGKWASSLGIEGNYTKDQTNYSRSFLFAYLPFYHTGVRATYKATSALSLNYWAVNGTQQTEAINGFKDQLAGFTYQPRPSITWTGSYYIGQEHPDTVYYPYGGAPPNSPALQGELFQPIRPAPIGKLHIVDSYVSWQATPKFSTALEGDYVLSRLNANSAPMHVAAGAVYARYQLTGKAALAARAEYLSDRGGLFSGADQALKEVTLTAEYKLAEGLTTRWEFRRDASNHPYFLTDRLGVFKKEQNTVTMGLIWWFGTKVGSW